MIVNGIKLISFNYSMMMIKRVIARSRMTADRLAQLVEHLRVATVYNMIVMLVKRQFM